MLGSELGGVAGEGVDGRPLFAELPAERLRLAGELAELDPVAEQRAQDGDDDGHSNDGADHDGAGKVEAEDPDAVPPNHEQTVLFAALQARALPPRLPRRRLSGF